MTLPSPRLHARVESSHKHKAQTQTRPSSSRNACRVSIFALISITGLYAMGFVVCSISLSHSLVSNSDTDGTRKLTRQVNWRPIRRHGVDSGPNTTNSKSEKKWMKELLESSTSRPDLRCIGWKHVDSCNLEATNLATRNRGCDQFVRGGVGGYCLMEIEAAGQQIQVMHTACETLHPSVMLSCRHAGDFVDFQWEVAKLATAIDKETARDDKRQMTALVSPQRSEGIVMVVYPKLLVSAYASIRALRAANCTLPIELWYQESEMLTKNGESLLDVIPKKLQEECGPSALLPNEKQQTDSSRVSMDDLSVPYALLRQNYLINIFSGAPEFEKTQWCYGQSTATASKFKTIAWEDTAFPTVERSLLEYAKEAAELIVQSYAEVDTTLA
ncbi:hypothetical protein PsorP6_011233 [Peronosclerospora sorghi]|uniref:Uncharacterized protein n=1 Tax=Peronosclerospora sorghi TaxID=230839 RepID=A0ACC0VXE1_9STRA|nr:hypothetical protein PsorP6_011233 [Peronosclerospora sorghi]